MIFYTTCPKKQRFQVDDEDADYISLFSWKAHANSDFIYRNHLVTDASHYPRWIYLHSYYFNFPPRTFNIRFRDGNKFNLRKSNIYLVQRWHRHDLWTTEPLAILDVDTRSGVARPDRRVALSQPVARSAAAARRAVELRERLLAAQNSDKGK